MRALAAIALATSALFLLPGCGEAEKAKEKQAMLDAIRTQVQAEVDQQLQSKLATMLPGEIQNQLRVMEEQKKQQAELEKQQAAANGGKKPDQAGPADPNAKPTTAPTTKKKKKHTSQ